MKRLLILTIITVMFSYISTAQEITTLDSLVTEALENNPEIKASIARWEASTMRPSQQGSLPNPIIGGKIKNVSFSEFTLGDDPRSDIQAFVVQEFPFPGKLSLKEQVALEHSEAQRWDSEAVSRNVIADLKTAYYEWFLANKAIDITNRNKELLTKFVEIAEVKYKVGKGIQQDVIKAQVEISSFIERLVLLKQKKEIYEARINSILNYPPGTDLGKPEEVTKAELKINLEKLTEIMQERAPLLNSKSEMIEKSEKNYELAKKQYYPDLILQGTYFNRSGGDADLDDIWEVGLGLRVPLYYWRKEKPGVQEKSYELREAKEIYDTTKNDILFTLNDNFITAKSAEKLIELYATGIIPQSKLSLESAISGYQVGDIDFLTLLDNLVTLFNFEIEYYKQLTEYQQSIARIEEITGLDLIM